MPATEKFSRSLKTLHVVFAVSSVVMFVATIWMMDADHRDEWRTYQKIGFRRDAALQAQQIQNIESPEYAAKLASLNAAHKAAESKLEASAASLGELRDGLTTASQQVDLLSRALREQNAARDVARANYDLAIRDNLLDDSDSLHGEFEDRQAKCDETTLELQQAQAKLTEARDKLDGHTAERDELAAQRKELTAERERIAAGKEKIDPSGWLQPVKRTVMEWPIIDGFNSHLKVHQDWLPNLRITLGMTNTARYDRCRTCHVSIDATVSGGAAAFPHGQVDSDNVHNWVIQGVYPHPFATHPRPDVYTTESSPHPVTKFGCTICHEGQGSGTSFNNAEHTPNDPHEFKQWHEEHGFHPNHFWEYPMYPGRFIESTCIKCHHNVVELGQHPKFGATAPKVYRGWDLIRSYGCFGCHEIQGYDGAKPIGPDFRLEPQTAEDARKYADDPSLIAGRMRKVGPSLRSVASKTTRGWIEHWTEKPSAFRPSTRMPQFFDLTNQEDETARAYEPVELAGVARFLLDKSQPEALDKPAVGYQADPQRGKRLFSERGCLACHSHREFPETKADFGPELTRVREKIRRNADNPDFSGWLYTWLREPERHHKRTKMPNLYLQPYKLGETTIDPAADITAWLLRGGPGDFRPHEVSDAVLDELVGVYLSQALSHAKVADVLTTGAYPIPRERIKGDEVELASESGEAVTEPAEWRRMKLNYVGRRTISRYGCYGCHDIPGFETARPIGTALQDWGRKDTSKLALEHIEEYLHEHGEPPDSKFESTHQRVEKAIAGAADAGYGGNPFATEEEEENELRTAYFYHSLQHHGRPGFIWQKLRQPRSYDYKKIETKGYHERLRMPKFPFNEKQIEAIATFVLGLVAEPPPEQYIHRPDGPEGDRIEGERLLAKYNCVGCHMLELPEVTWAVDIGDVQKTELLNIDPAEAALEPLLKLMPPRQGLTGDNVDLTIEGETVNLPVASFRGLKFRDPDPLEDPVDRFHAYDLWEPLYIGEELLLPGSRMIVPVPKTRGITPARGGTFAQWLVERLMETTTDGNRSLAWQASPPPLYREGLKVQTPWLYQFLLEPHQIRYTTVLRMPRFNMSPQEARSLANYFAAVDGAPYPYQDVRPRDPDYLAARKNEVSELMGENDDYLGTGWKVLNGTLCIKCHSVGGRTFKVSDPKKDVHAPDLRHAARRLRPEWTEVWLFKPSWLIPYTSMPVNFKQADIGVQFPDLFQGDTTQQVTGVRDALMNYPRLMETIGPVVYTPPGGPPKAEAGGD